jgi:Flp pilus assembly protein TadG
MKLIRKEQGLATVETVFAVLAFLLVLFVIIDWSLVFYDKAVISGCSSTFAQQEATSLSTAKPTQAALQASAATACANLISLGTSSTPNVVLNADNNTTQSATCTLPTIATGTNVGTTGNCVSVTVTYNYTGLAGLGAIFETVASGTQILSSTTVVYNQ